MNDLTPSTSPPRFAWDWVGLWTLVFVGNLPIPVLFGQGVVGEGGMCGLFGALAVLYWIGFALCLFRFRVGRSLVVGGVFIAATQLLPILHILCGSFGLMMWEAIGGGRFFSDDGFEASGSGWQTDRNMAAVIIVFFTAHPLLVVAVLIGVVIRHVAGDRPIWFARRGDPDAEPDPS